MNMADPGFKLAGELSARQRPPGLSVAVLAERTARSEGFGFADIETRQPVSPETVYLWFSMTKLVTATAIVQLAERGALELDLLPHLEPAYRAQLAHAVGHVGLI